MKSRVRFDCHHSQERYIYDPGSVVGEKMHCETCDGPRTVTSVSVPSIAEPYRNEALQIQIEETLAARAYAAKLSAANETLRQANKKLREGLLNMRAALPSFSLEGLRNLIDEALR